MFNRSTTILACLTGILLLAACTPVNQVSVGPSVSATATVGPLGGDPNGPMILASILRGTIYPGPGTSSCTVQANVGATGTPLTIDSATLVAPGPTYINLVPLTQGYHYDAGAGGWNYVPGQTYTIQVVIAGIMYSATVQAVGGVTVPADFTTGPITWGWPGNQDNVSIAQLFSPYAQTLVGPIALSGSISTGDAAYFPSAGDYALMVNVLKANIGAFGANAYPGASFIASDQHQQDYSR